MVDEICNEARRINKSKDVLSDFEYEVMGDIALWIMDQPIRSDRGVSMQEMINSFWNERLN